MVEMKVLEKQLINNLKSRFFDLIDTDSNLLSYEEFLKEMLFILKTFVGADQVTLFNCNDIKTNLYIEASTEGDLDSDSFSLPFLCEEFKNAFLDKCIMRKPLPFAGLEGYELILHLRKGNKSLGFLALNGVPNCPCPDELIINVAEECANFLHKVEGFCNVIFEEKRYKQLFRVTEKFHSSMDMDAVLGEIIDTLKEVYPTFTYYLMLSHDNNSHGNLPIKDLEYDSENVTAMQAYVTGTIQLEDSLQERRSILYAPLKGKQGVYGVLQVMAPNTMTFPKNEVEFITLLANTAGSALENAQLYQQSRKLITDLQLINETSHRLNSNLRLTETISFMTEQIRDSFDAEEIGFLLVSEDFEQMKVINGSTDFFFSDEALIYLHYIVEKIKKDRDSIFLGDLTLVHTSTEYRSLMAVPMIQSGIIKGFVLVLHRNPYQFTFETFKLLQSLIHHSTLAFTNSMLREELEKMVITDQLTKLFSRNYLNDKIYRSMAEDAYGAYLLIDIDDFKNINDSYGHQVGDEVLIQVANILQDSIRDTDIAARWGGEELAVYLPKIQQDIAVTIAERLVKKVRELTNPRVTISCGVSFWKKEHSSDSFTKLFKRADKALYVAKETGKNKVVVQEEIQIMD